jgi:hypothetical protein
MIFNDKVIRVLIVAAVWIFAQAAPALAEKVTLACSRGGDYITFYYTFDMAKKIVKEGPRTFAITVTEDEISWKSYVQGGYQFLNQNIYNRHSAELTIYFFNGPTTIGCRRVQDGPL